MTDDPYSLEMAIQTVLSKYGGSLQSVDHGFDSIDCSYAFGHSQMIANRRKVTISLEFPDENEVVKLFSDVENWLEEKDNLEAALEKNADLKESYEQFLILRRLYGL